MNNGSQKSEESTRPQQVLRPELSGAAPCGAVGSGRVQTVSRKGAKYAESAKKAKTKVLYFLCVLCAFA
jgi:hypothetical protein